ncbi:MAG TPA: hypothetical protein VLS45_09920 [Methylomicrobium sp.]|nr:hypothetical protein [Methylomicrobium sp.]
MVFLLFAIFLIINIAGLHMYCSATNNTVNWGGYIACAILAFVAAILGRDMFS